MIFFAVVVKLVDVVNLVMLAGYGGGGGYNCNYLNDIDKSERHTRFWHSALVCKLHACGCVGGGGDDDDGDSGDGDSGDGDSGDGSRVNGVLCIMVVILLLSNITTLNTNIPLPKNHNYV